MMPTTSMLFFSLGLSFAHSKKIFRCLPESFQYPEDIQLPELDLPIHASPERRSFQARFQRRLFCQCSRPRRWYSI